MYFNIRLRVCTGLAAKKNAVFARLHMINSRIEIAATTAKMPTGNFDWASPQMGRLADVFSEVARSVCALKGEDQGANECLALFATGKAVGEMNDRWRQSASASGGSGYQNPTCPPPFRDALHG